MLLPWPPGTPRRDGAATTRIRAALARIPIPIVAALPVVGGALIPVQEWRIARAGASGSPGPPQWPCRLTVTWYYASLSLAVLALWARRRSTGRGSWDGSEPGSTWWEVPSSTPLPRWEGALVLVLVLAPAAWLPFGAWPRGRRRPPS